MFLTSALTPILAPPPIDTFAGTVIAQNLDFKQGMIQQYNLNIEHQLPANVVLTVGYAGSYSTHILVSGMNLNITSPECVPRRQRSGSRIHSWLRLCGPYVALRSYLCGV